MFKFYIGLLSTLSLFATDYTALSPKELLLVKHVEESLQKGERYESKLNDRVLAIEGFSAKKIKHLLNNLCTLQDATYLEIGCWNGSTLCAAVTGNESILKQVIAIDNWSEFGGPKKKFFRNTSKFIRRANLQMVEQDCFTVNLHQVFSSPVNIYFYDGAHDYASQKNAFTYFHPIFDDVFIALVDDWRWADTRNGTLDALAELNYEILYRADLYSSTDSDLEAWDNKECWNRSEYWNREEYWNGLTLLVLRKP